MTGTYTTGREERTTAGQGPRGSADLGDRVPRDGRGPDPLQLAACAPRNRQHLRADLRQRALGGRLTALRIETSGLLIALQSANELTFPPVTVPLKLPDPPSSRRTGRASAFTRPTGMAGTG